MIIGLLTAGVTTYSPEVCITVNTVFVAALGPGKVLRGPGLKVCYFLFPPASREKTLNLDNSKAFCYLSSQMSSGS